MQSNHKLKSLNPEDTSNIKVIYFQGNSGLTDYQNILVVKYMGKYGFGSAGNDDARYMYAKAEYGLNIYEPNAVILDFSELEYQWGDMLELVFNVGSHQYIHKAFPKALVLGEKCRAAIATLIHGNDEKTATSEDWIFDSFDEAWNYMKKMINDVH